MEIPFNEIDAYLKELAPKRDQLLSEMEETAEEEMFPIVSPLTGRLLYQLVKISKAKMIFELGSGFGYSALWMAMAMSEGGQIICTEFDRKKAELGLKFLERAELRDKVIYEVGDALESLQRYHGPFDLIFCDLNKEQYPQALKMGIPRLKSGGIFLADNALWSGRVLDSEDQSEATNGIRKYNEEASNNPSLFTTLLPIGDGLSLSLKK